jgi:hypothetical protein
MVSPTGPTDNEAADLVRKRIMMPDARRRPARIAIPLLAATALVSILSTGSAAAETCNGPPRKINVGVSVSPPNVVHTTAYVAKGSACSPSTASTSTSSSSMAARRRRPRWRSRRATPLRP